MRVCSSSMNRMIFLASLTSLIMRLMRSSNCPRYLVPAITEARSSAITRFPNSDRGTCSFTIAAASPSTIEVFPTPGSPIKTGLFLLRRDNICITRRISRSLPITGSRSPSRVICVRSLLNSDNTLCFFFSCCCLSCGVSVPLR